MIWEKLYSHGSSRIKTKDLNTIFNLHGLIENYKQQMILWEITYSHGSSKMKTKDFNKNFN